MDFNFCLDDLRFSNCMEYNEKHIGNIYITYPVIKATKLIISDETCINSRFI